MIKIPKLTLDDVTGIEIKNEYEDFNYLNSKKANISEVIVNIDIEKYCSILDSQEEISETFGDVSNNLIEPAFHTYEDTSTNNRIYTMDIQITGEAAKYFSKEYFESLLEGVNQTVENMIHEKLGANLEIFIESKQKEKELDLLTDYGNQISMAVYLRLQKDLGDDYKFLCKSQGINFIYSDVNQYNDKIIQDENYGLGIELKIIKRHNSAHEDAIEPTRLKRIEHIEKNNFVKHISYPQKNNYYWIKIHTNDDFKNYVKTVAQEETQRFYNSPIYENEEGTFLGRVNDGKGNDADVWKVNNNIVVKNSKGYIDDPENELFIKSKTFEQKVKNTKKVKPT